MKRRTVYMLFTVFFTMYLLTGCGTQKPEEKPDEKAEQKESVADYYEMVNKQWLEEHTEFPGFYYGTVQEQQDKVEKALDDYLMELSELHSSKTESLSETQEKAVIFYEQTNDMEKRNELGIHPIETMLAKVEETNGLEGLIRLYKEENFSYFNTLFAFEVAKYPADGSYQVRVYPKTIYGQYGMLTTEQFAEYEALVKQLMILSGYGEERAAEIAGHTMEVERRILSLNYYQMKDFSRYGEKELEYLLSNLPLLEIAKVQGYLEERNGLLCEKEHLDLLQELFTEENAKMLKDYLLAAIVVKSAPYLNEEMGQCYKTAVNALMGAEGEKEDSNQGCEIVVMAMEDFLAEYYMEEYVGETLKQEVESLTEEIREEFIGKIAQADWMGEETKNYAIKKLEAMKLLVGLPEKRHDYSKLTVLSYEEGGNLLSNILNAYLLDCNFQKELLKEECESVYYFHSLEVNATYAPAYNTFAMNAAILTMDGCNQDSEYEEKLAILGFTIAHEMSHGFDGSGSNFTLEGKYQDWWTTEDKAAYRERINEVKHYYDGMKVNENLTLAGENVMDEAYADLSAMSVCMDLLNKREQGDFKLFFETYGKMERIAMTDEFLAYLVGYDSHLPSNIRVNQVVNQMDEFYEVYQVTEDSELYVPKEERLKVWE